MLINFLEIEAGFDPKVILQRLGEEKESLLSKIKDDVGFCAADLDPENILASNWCYLSKSEVGEVPYTVGYEITLQMLSASDAPLSTRVEFETIKELQSYNSGLGNSAVLNPEDSVLDVWNKLTLAHYKGIHTVHYQGTSMDKFQYRNYLTFQRNALLKKKKDSGLLILK